MHWHRIKQVLNISVVKREQVRTGLHQAGLYLNAQSMLELQAVVHGLLG